MVGVAVGGAVLVLLGGGLWLWRGYKGTTSRMILYSALTQEALQTGEYGEVGLEVAI